MVRAIELTVVANCSLHMIYYRAKKLGIKANGRYTEREARAILNYRGEKTGRKPGGKGVAK